MTPHLNASMLAGAVMAVTCMATTHAARADSNVTASIATRAESVAAMAASRFAPTRRYRIAWTAPAQDRRPGFISASLPLILGVGF